MKKIILSDQKLNLLVDDVTEQILTSGKVPGDHITSNSLAEACPHPQVRQFILFRIYQDATQFVAQLNHPHFDFQSADLKDELRRLLASLSRNIRIPRRDFDTLLRQAVYNSIKLILNPEDSITNFFFGGADAIPLELYRKHAPYFTDYDFVIRAILAWHEKQQLTRVEKDVFLDKFQRVIELYEKKEGKSLGDYQRIIFKTLTGQEMDAVIGSSTPPIIRTESAAPSFETPVFEEKKSSPAQDQSKVDPNKKPLISIKPKEKETPVQQPKEEEKLPWEEPKSIPPWVDAKTPPPVVEEKKSQPIFSTNSTPPRSETPPWVKPETPEKKEAVILDPVTPIEEEQPKKEEEKPSLEKKTLGGSFDQKPKSLNDRFVSQTEEKSVNRLTTPVEKPAEDKPKTLLERLNEGKEEKPKEQPVSFEVKSEPIIEVPKVETPPVIEHTPPVVKENKPLVESFQETPVTRTPIAAETETKTTVADRFKEQSGNESLGDSLGAKNIKTDQIPVHKQFQYVQKVFSGSSVKFKVILDKINKTQTLAEAEEVLEKYVFNDPSVNRNDKVAKEFEQLVRARFE